MRGLMMDFPLTIPVLVRRIETLFPGRPIVGRRPDRSVIRTDYASVVDRVRRLGVALADLGVEPGDRVATLGWNSQEHLEAYLAIPSIGAVLHTLNLRLHPDDLVHIISDARDRVLIVDECLLPLYEKLRSRVRFEHVVVIRQGMSGEAAVSSSIDSGAAPFDYEALLAAADPGRYAEPPLDEHDAAAMCYTSGTTGQPKGVLYSHRALVLHSFGQGLVDSLGASTRDTILPVVPMFHVNAWGLPFTAALFGAGQVFPGPHLDPKSLLELLSAERVTLTAGVPTIFLGVLQALDAQPGAYDLSSLRGIVIGGSSVPPSLIRGFKERHGLEVIHAWGMTETTPCGTLCRLPATLDEAPADVQIKYRARQGTPLPLVEIRGRAADGLVPWDSQTMGELEIRGPWVARQYFNGDDADDRFTSDGWFRTGDIVTIDASGCIELTDRLKDLVKSGGEWISSVALETALMGHPSVAEAAVIAVPHARWGERPLAVVVLRPGASATQAELRAHLTPQFAKWWLPDVIEFATEIPRTSVGKFRKSELRERYRERYATTRT